MRITKTIAADVAAQMSKPAFEVADKLKSEFETAATTQFLANVPAPVRKLWEDRKLSGWINTLSFFAVKGMGVNTQTVWPERSLPYNGENGTLVLNAETEHIAHAYNTWRDALKTAKDLKEELDITLQNLKTYARVQQELPEASKYLPAATSTALVVNTAKLREKLAGLPQTSENNG